VKAVFTEADDPEVTENEKRARQATALDYQRRVEAAIDTVRELQAEGKDAPRASTTDADARVMKMGDGGFRPAYNVQMATAGSEMGGPHTIVGVHVTNIGSDMGSVTPMLDQIEQRTGTLPKVLLAGWTPTRPSVSTALARASASCRTPTSSATTASRKCSFEASRRSPAWPCSRRWHRTSSRTPPRGSADRTFRP
jgi:hypothetical protein